ncbi:hypothetical protein UY568_22270, partial [Escherichia coli]|nr:hypothetical protein [Escherichia coli]MDY8662538.1 hypothetical protein [Escherichia coli]
PKTSIICSPMTSLKTSIKTITYLSDIGCLEIQGASLPIFWGLTRIVFTVLVNAVSSEHIFNKIDTDSRDGHNESLRGYVYPMIA